MTSTLQILCAVQVLNVGLVVAGLDYTFLNAYELIPAVVLHVIILVYIKVYYDTPPWHIVIAALTGLVVQSVWLDNQVRRGIDIGCMTDAYNCRHRVEYYVSAGYVAAVYTCALMLESAKYLYVSEGGSFDSKDDASNCKTDLILKESSVSVLLKI